MSSGADCQFVEYEPGLWKYKLQRYPYGDTEQYDTFGPFSSFQSAEKHLSNNHQNPGGWMTTTHPTNHKHELTMERGAWEPSGFTVSITVESLGPNATREQLIELLKTLPPDAPYWRVTPTQRWNENAVTKTCAACGETL